MTIPTTTCFLHFVSVGDECPPFTVFAMFMSFMSPIKHHEKNHVNFLNCLKPQEGDSFPNPLNKRGGRKLIAISIHLDVLPPRRGDGRNHVKKAETTGKTRFC